MRYRPYPEIYGQDLMGCGADNLHLNEFTSCTLVETSLPEREQKDFFMESSMGRILRVP